MTLTATARRQLSNLVRPLTHSAQGWNIPFRNPSLRRWDVVERERERERERKKERQNYAHLKLLYVNTRERHCKSVHLCATILHLSSYKVAASSASPGRRQLNAPAILLVLCLDILLLPVLLGRISHRLWGAWILALHWSFWTVAKYLTHDGCVWYVVCRVHNECRSENLGFLPLHIWLEATCHPLSLSLFFILT